MARVKEAAAEALTAVESSVAHLAGSAEDAVITTTAAALAAPKKLARSSSSSSSLPGPAQFVLAVALSYGISTVGKLGVGYFSPGEWASIARVPADNVEGGVVLGWKLLVLALGWLGDFDGYDLASLALLSHGPATFLVSVFYDIRWVTAGAYLGVEVVSAALPFLLLRRLDDKTNSEIIADRSIQVLTSLQAGLVYSVVLFLAGRTFLSDVFVLHFEGIPTIKPAVEPAGIFAGKKGLATGLLGLLMGLAARRFIFAPVVTAPEGTVKDEENERFDPASASLGETIKWNLWGWKDKTKVSVVRTGVAVVATAVGTYLDTALGIKGVDGTGAGVYAGVWGLAVVLTGWVLTYVGSI
ncbi:hypothetical protein QBC40DRAFT_321130 [Triangularia verruculosa]|uniref:Uncharacterized protein n=1 Tax=Triangularia verruculosa TaxID=2587418 RepID=A0AAN6XQJ3_9PEZI|nr:hypothetical protein QBC40DRAFT_321130 [Triangularia verruculosa]